jgi:hypothetical protein
VFCFLGGWCWGRYGRCKRQCPFCMRAHPWLEGLYLLFHARNHHQADHQVVSGSGYFTSVRRGEGTLVCILTVIISWRLRTREFESRHHRSNFCGFIDLWFISSTYCRDGAPSCDKQQDLSIQKCRNQCNNIEEVIRFNDSVLPENDYECSAVRIAGRRGQSWLCPALC